MNAPCAIVNFKATSEPVATIRYFSNPKKVVGAYDGLTTGVAFGSAKDLADLLLSSHHDRRTKRCCRTAVISVQTPRRATKEQLADIDNRLLQAAADLQKILKVAAMLGWIHGNTRTRHLHLIFPNSTGRRTLDLRPKFLRQLQGFLWTAAFISGRGRGRRKALPVYPRARKLAVRDLARLLMDAHGNLRQDRWDALVKAGKISNLRRRNDGSLISFEWGAKRVRVATLKGIATELTQPENTHDYETNTSNIGLGQSVEPVLEPDQSTEPSANATVPPPATGPGQPPALPVAGATKPDAAGPAVRVATLRPGLAVAVALDVLAGRTPEPATTGAVSLPVGGLALPRQPGFRRAGQQPASAQSAPAKTPAPRRFKRLARPGIR